MSTRFIDHLLVGIIADRPAATAVPAGTLYSVHRRGDDLPVRRHQLGRLGRLPAKPPPPAEKVIQVKVIDDATTAHHRRRETHLRDPDDS